MIRVHLKKGVLGEFDVTHRMYDWSGRTLRELAEHARLPEWDRVPLRGFLDGHPLDGADWDATEPLDGDLILMPEMGDVVTPIVYILLSAAIQQGIGYLYQLLVPQPEPPDLVSERGDEASPTYGFGGAATQYGIGSMTPAVYGEHDVPGAAIYVEALSSTTNGALNDTLRIVLSLAQGRIESIGGIDGGTLGEFDAVDGTIPGTFPADIRIDDNRLDPLSPGATVWGRTGLVTQSPIPAPFVGAATTYLINEQLDVSNAQAVFTVTDTGELEQASFVMLFPSGLFQQDGSGGVQAFAVSMIPEWRFVGETAWRPFWTGGGPITLSQFSATATTIYSETVSYFFQNPVLGQSISGPIEIRVSRATGTGTTQQVGRMTWRQLVITKPYTYSYPEEALLAIEVTAGERFSGGLPNIISRIRGHRIRIWDPNTGWTGRIWTRPNSPTQWMLHDVGPNPAWCALDFLLNVNYLGRWLTEENIDLMAFRQWSIYCDNKPGPSGYEWDEARFRCDIVMDQSRKAWDWLVAICRCGRAAPIIVGNKISVVYQYRDAHSDSGPDGTITVPARAPTQLLCDANVQDLTITYLERGRRPSSIEFEYWDAQKDYAASLFPVDEDISYYGWNGETKTARDTGFRKESRDARGVTRISQLYREGAYIHRLNRMVRAAITFKTWVSALALAPGDVFSFQHDALRPYSTTALGLSIEVGGSNVTTVTVDRNLTASGGTDRLIMRGSQGEIIDAQVASISGKDVTLTAAVSVNPGAPCAFGVEDAITKDYQVVDINLDNDLMRTVRAIEWRPEAHEEPRYVDLNADSTLDVNPGQGNFESAQAFVDAADVSVNPCVDCPGVHRIAWAAPSGSNRSAARVYARPKGSSRYWRVGEVSGQDHHIDWEGMSAFQDWEVVVTLADAFGRFSLPDGLTPASVTAQEFPSWSPPDASKATAQQVEGGVLVSWAPVDYEQFLCYEVRHGTRWLGAEVVYRGEQASFVHRDPSYRGDNYMVAVQSRNRLYSQSLETVAALSTHVPFGRVLQASLDEIPPTQSLPTEIAHDASNGWLHLVDGYLFGTYTGGELDLTYEGEAYWTVSAVAEFWGGEDASEWTWDASSGEARWFRETGREASAGKPGVDWDSDTSAEPWSLDVAEMPGDLWGSGYLGDPGKHAIATIETRFYVGGAWGSWAPHSNGWRVAERMQARVTLGRDRYADSIRLVRFELNAAI